MSEVVKFTSFYRCVHSSSPPHCQRLLLNLTPVDKLESLDVSTNYSPTRICFTSLRTAWFFHSQDQTLIAQHAHCLCCGLENDWEHPIASANSHVEVADCVCVPRLWVGNIILLSLSQLTFRERYKSHTHTHTLQHPLSATARDKELSLSCVTSFSLI